MGKKITDIRFTNNADRARSVRGWDVDKRIVVDTLAGDDTIIASNIYSAIDNDGTITTGEGNDGITGEGSWGISNNGKINTGTDDDFITGIGFPGRYGGYGISNRGTITTGEGNDSITGEGRRRFGISNWASTIKTGAGNDIITGTGNKNNAGIYNTGKIDTGTGNDIIDALIGGFGGYRGKTDLGTGNDTIKSFGTGSFHGGTGEDTILLGEGTYAISGTYHYGSTIISGGETMYVNKFEQIGGFKGGLFEFKEGRFTVGSMGVGTYA